MDPQEASPASAAPSPLTPPSWPEAEGWQQPLTWPAPPPAYSPPVMAPARWRPRRWSIVGLAIGAVLLGLLGVATGAAAATASAESKAQEYQGRGDFATAIAVDRVIEQRNGAIYVLDPTAAMAASAAEAQTVLDWARSAGRAGRIDEAVALYRSVLREPMRTRAIAALGALLVSASSAEAAKGAYPSAIARLQEVIALAPASPAATRARRQLPIDQAGEARRLLTAGNGPDAVALLATIVAEGSTAATRTADSLYPEALLEAGQEEMAQLSYVEALADLQRLVTNFPQSEQASLARSLLTAPQPVSGTLVNRVGIAASGPVRLSTNYKAEPGGTYKTSGPFYNAMADKSGDFTFTAVPVGGPYVLEVFSAGNWTTLIDPSTGQPSHPVKVSALIPADLTFVVLPS